MWFLETETLAKLKHEYEITPEAEAKHNMLVSSSSIISISNREAIIHIKGVLTDEPSLLAQLIGGGNTTYTDISNAVAFADDDDAIDEITLFINSPGGSASAGWIDVMDIIAAADKPIKAVVGNIAASAAYGIASQADTILAQNRMSRVGSIGVVASYRNDDNVIEITSSEAPNKRPDIKTEEGVKRVRDELDDMHEIFVEAVALGRKTTVNKVNSDFGRGAMVLAGNAIEKGMIDGFFKTTKEAPAMDLNTLKMEHCEIFDAVIAEERDRVCAHLKLGQESGDMVTAIKAVEEGSELTQALTAQYLAFGMKKKDIENRHADEETVSIAVEAETKSEAEDVAANIMSLAAQNLGYKLSGAK
jgi:ClpP class serine protease